jgi:hypothetical protein
MRTLMLELRPSFLQNQGRTDVGGVPIPTVTATSSSKAFGRPTTGRTGSATATVATSTTSSCRKTFKVRIQKVKRSKGPMILGSKCSGSLGSKIKGPKYRKSKDPWVKGPKVPKGPRNQEFRRSNGSEGSNDPRV